MMIANRESFAAARRRGPTARDYVQDGLVAMWDGIENAGWGTHDQNATVWKDLVGTRDATLRGSYSWGSNCWDVQSVSGRGIATWDGMNLPSSQTWEILVNPTATTSFGRILAEAQSVASPCIRQASSDVLHMYGYGLDYGSSIVGFDNRMQHLHTIVHPSGGPMNYYIDGRLVWTQTTTQDSLGATYGYFANNRSYTRGIDAMYFSVRLYSRAMPVDEIAQNYAIDKERFNLP